MSSLTCITSLPPELLYTILSHALADMLFDYLFIGALSLDHCQGLLDEISSLGGVSVAWRATLHRILAALLHVPSHSQSLLPTKHQIHQLTLTRTRTRTRTRKTARAHPSSNTPISISATSQSASTIDTTNHTINPNADTIPSLHSYQRTLHTMQIALRDLVQHSIDTYRNEQDQDATMGGQANQTGVTTPTLLPPPVQVPPPVMQGQGPAGNGNGNGNGVGVGTPPLVPHSIPHPPASVSTVSNPIPSAPTQPPPPPANANNQPLGALLLIAAAVAPTLKQYAPTLKQYATTPLFQAALCYSQAAVFTCGASNSFSWGKTLAVGGPTGRIIAANANANGACAAVRRPDLSTLVLTTPRLVVALEWVRAKKGSRDVGICPREVCEVVECGMGEVRERMEDAIRVCRWNDLLHAVFLRGERSEEMLEALDGCFDDLEANAGSIQMHHLLRSNLFKTVQTIARLGPISLGMNLPLQVNSDGNGNGMNTPPRLSSDGEIWRSRAGALAFRWMGRVVEWTGL